MRALDLAVGFLLLARSLHRPQLLFGEHPMLLRGFGFQRLPPFAKGLQIVSQPHASYPVGETNSPRLVSSFATLTWPSAGFSKAIVGATLWFPTRVPARGILLLLRREEQ